MKIVSFKICPFVQRVTALLEVKNVPYEVEYIDLNNKPDWFLEKSPHGQVPILITDNDEVIFESDAIVEYIDEAIGLPLSAKNAIRKAQDRAWSYLATKNYLAQCGTMRSRDKDILAEKSEKLGKIFGKMENYLGEGPFAGGDKMGMVDVAWITLLHRAHIIEQHSGFDFLDGFPKVQQWQKALMATGIAEKSVAADFESKFMSFYLADVTYLGRIANDPEDADQANVQPQTEKSGCC